MYVFKYTNGHVLVYLHGKFEFSADTKDEALAEIESGDVID